MKYTFLLTISLILNVYFSIASDTTKVLFIGNSFTAVENVPDLVKGMALAAGMEMEIIAHTPGGISVGDVSQGAQAHMNNPYVYELIRDHKADYIVLQDNQGRFVDSNGFPPTNLSQVVAGHLKIRDSMRYHNNCSRMILFAGWALKNGWQDIGNGEQCIKNIYKNYLALNEDADEIIAPIGIAWLRSMTQLPGVDLWSLDEAHQSYAGAYLTAATIFTSIYRINTEQVDFPAQLDSTTARVLRQISYETVTDSIQPTSLADYIPALSVNTTTLTATPGYSNYEWYRDNILFATTNSNTVNISTTGYYHVIAENSSGCKQRSPQQYVDFSTSIAAIDGLSFKLWPNPASQSLLIKTMKSSGVKKYNIISLTGRIVIAGTFSAETIAIPLSDLPSGLYICELSINNIKGRKKFSKVD